ncbi:hypothetical protein BALOs_1433 [Halobacteriovorax sp. BALOs_7]|nr:hypothetical protein [Halobacteriovorax sp. BALOs_7]AYF44434.1 hypothetical protein BALOs_1433 [Halobacteriovorax sp. BALOs_7]
MKKIITLAILGLTLVSCSSTPDRGPSSKKQFDSYKFQDSYENVYKNGKY